MDGWLDGWVMGGWVGGSIDGLDWIGIGIGKFYLPTVILSKYIYFIRMTIYIYNIHIYSYDEYIICST